MLSSHSSQSDVAGHVVWGVIIRRGLAAAAAILVLSSTSGCMVEAMYAVPIALDGAASSIARALPVDEKKYIVHSNRLPPGEPALACAPRPQPAASALANAAKPHTTQAIPQPTAATAPVPLPAATVESPTPMPVLTAGALARRTRT